MIFFLITRTVKGGGSGEELAAVGGRDAQTGSLLGVQVRGYQVGDEGSIIRIEREEAGI